MPHAVSMANPGLQALILCGPGASLNTFTSNPQEIPKALISIANRPMVWYPLDFCYRMGITDITLITPPSSTKALEAALSQNPHLTSLPLPRPTVLAPEDLTQTSGTAEILRLAEVRDAIEGDFVILPCDIVCSIPGESFLEQWMVHQAMLDAHTRDNLPNDNIQSSRAKSNPPPKPGALGVWFPTKGEGSVKGEETDFIITAPFEASRVTAPASSLANNMHKLAYSTTKDTLKDILDDKGHFPIRPALIRKHGRVKILSTYRDAHIYVFPRWVLDFVASNEDLDSISEDVIGWWARSGWQDGLAQKLGLEDVLLKGTEKPESGQMTSVGSLADIKKLHPASRSSTLSQLDEYTSQAKTTSSFVTKIAAVPPILAYVQPSGATPLIRRVDTAALLLFVSLTLAKLPSIEEANADGVAPSPFAHAAKIAQPSGIAPRCTVIKADCLLADNVTVEEKCVIKESVIGANCHVKTGARLTRCVLMDGAVVEEKCQLSGCILGRRAQVGKDSVLKDCEVQDGNKVPDETEAKGEKFMIFEGLEEGEDGLDLGDTEDER